MNIGTPHIRFTPLSAFILLGLFAILRSAWASPAPKDMEAVAEKLRSRSQDMNQLSQSLTPGLEERYIAQDLTSVATNYFSEAAHIEDLLIIRSLVESETDKNKIQPYISRRIKELAKEIDHA